MAVALQGPCYESGNGHHKSILAGWGDLEQWLHALVLANELSCLGSRRPTS